MPNADKLNSRYRAYMSAHLVGDRDLMLEIDAQRFPGGKMVGFIVWGGTLLREWLARTGTRRPLSAADHAAFDAWLAERFPALASAKES